MFFICFEEAQLEPKHLKKAQLELESLHVQMYQSELGKILGKINRDSYNMRLMSDTQ